MPDWARFVEAKLRLARRGSAPTRAEPAPERLPPGQHWVKNFPVLDLGRRPKIARKAWRCAVSGAVERPLDLDWDALQALPQQEIQVDIHCVTRWSKADMPWRGVRLREVLALAGPTTEATHLMLHSADGYTTNIPIEDAERAEVLLAHTAEGRALSREHGGPVRALVPHRYFWKSAKWLCGIELLDADAPGFWEDRGYHNAADPRLEERYRGGA
jgi:DMSO/TMAO reductase YedYZ molybdopterin-dependent catalytic subunit